MLMHMHMLCMHMHMLCMHICTCTRACACSACQHAHVRQYTVVACLCACRNEAWSLNVCFCVHTSARVVDDASADLRVDVGTAAAVGTSKHDRSCGPYKGRVTVERGVGHLGELGDVGDAALDVCAEPSVTFAFSIKEPNDTNRHSPIPPSRLSCTREGHREARHATRHRKQYVQLQPVPADPPVA